ncbi:MAG: YcaO-like family protein [Granulosicoccaceae bacterium]
MPINYDRTHCSVSEETRKLGGHQTQCEHWLHRLYQLEGFKRCFFERCPDAPGLHFVGGQINNQRIKRILSFTGTGINRCDALARAYSEACEASTLGLNDTAHSAGLGASTDDDEAITHSVFELIEHDALAHWWYGNKKPQPLRQSKIELKKTHLLVKRLRQGINTRGVNLLTLNSYLKLPVVAALSFDQQGQCIALGSAARASTYEAIEASIREMCQMEYAHHLVRDKLQRGGYSVLNHEDRLTIHRASVITKKKLQSYIDKSDRSDKSCACQGPASRLRLMQYLNSYGVYIDCTKLAEYPGEIKVYRSRSRQLRQFVPVPETQRPNTMKTRPPFYAFERLLP